MLEVTVSGSVVVSGGLNAGKTRLTAETLRRYAEYKYKYEYDKTVVLLDFAPEFVRDGDLVGGHVSRFVEVPETVSTYVLEANAPRLEADTEEETLELARDNYERGISLIDSAPDSPDAVFVNDATIPFQYTGSDPETLTRYCSRADDSLLNFYDTEADSERESDGLPSSSSQTDVVDLNERRTVEWFRDWSDTEIRL
ncbi:MAG: hypothetical protein SV253_04135 [Halobacteria archaeon]|nr:hypothetical protein [Halobacteria archaeon]